MTQLTKPSATADINAAMRAAEHHQPERLRLLEDPFARTFIQRRSYRLLSRRAMVARAAIRAFDRFYGGLHAEIILRNRYYHDALEKARDQGFEQLVLLGAGYDSLAFREDLSPLTVFEVDAEPTQRSKLAAVARSDLQPRTPTRYVTCDFERDDVAERLVAEGFAADRPTLFVWLGVSYYLPAEAVVEFLEKIAVLGGLGSRIVWDYMDSSVIDGTTGYRSARRAAASVAKRGEPYVFGLLAETMPALCARAGLVVRDQVRIPELAERYAPPDGVWCRVDDYMGVVTAEPATAA